MRYAVIIDGAVANVVEAAQDTEFPQDWTVIASDSANIGDAFNAVSGEFMSPPEPEPPAPTVEQYQAAIERHIDAVAQSKQYSNGVALASYVNSTNPQWSAEAVAFIAWRDAVWHYAYTMLAAVQAGEHEPPALDTFIEELPVIEW